jgi:hypothetical protein
MLLAALRSKATATAMTARPAVSVAASADITVAGRPPSEAVRHHYTSIAHSVPEGRAVEPFVFRHPQDALELSTNSGSGCSGYHPWAQA